MFLYIYFIYIYMCVYIHIYYMSLLIFFCTYSLSIYIYIYYMYLYVCEGYQWAANADANLRVELFIGSEPQQRFGNKSSVRRHRPYDIGTEFALPQYLGPLGPTRGRTANKNKTIFGKSIKQI